MPRTEPLVPYGWDQRVEALFFTELPPDPNAGPDDSGSAAQPGRVGRVERTSCLVHLADGEVLAEFSSLPAVGDWVAVRVVDEGTAIVETILPRWSALRRQDPGNENADQVLAANIDIVFIVAPLDRLRLPRIERELLVAWESGARPVVVLTKADLAPDAETIAADVTARLVGADVVLTSSVADVGIDEVHELLQPNLTAVLFGPSGAGKSTLANALLGEDRLATGAVRGGDHRGRHTTTSRHLVPLPRGGILIDTPGIRGIAVWSGEEGLAAAFADVEAFAGGCRFRDCRHESEPGCAVNAAVASGELNRDRVASYRKLVREVEWAENAHEVAFQQARKRKWKAITKSARRNPKPSR